MATINIHTTEEEHKAVVEALKVIGPNTASMTLIATKAKVSVNRVRYILSDLVDAGKIAKIPTKQFGEHYVRYSYEVLT